MSRMLRAIIIAGGFLIAQAAVAQVNLPVTSGTLSLPTCQAGQFLTWNGSALSCGTPPIGGDVTVTAGPGISVSGGPAYVVQASCPVVTKTASYAFAAGDAAHMFVYNGAAAATFTLPASGSSGFGNGWGVCLLNRGPGALTLAAGSPSIFYGGPTVLSQKQSECVQADDGGNWLLFTGVAPVVGNPNAWQ